MNTRSSIFILYPLTCAALAAFSGCDDVTVNLERPADRPGRPAPVPITPAPAARTPQPAPAAQPPAATLPAESPTAQPVVSTRAFQQLVLLSEPGPEDPPPGVQYLRLNRAAAGDVGRLVGWLYVPAGPAGSRDRFCLVYPSTIEADAAARLARELDLPVLTDLAAPIPPEGADAFAHGIGLLYGQSPDEPPDPERCRRAESALATAAADAALPAMARWIAAMIAGRAAAELRHDAQAAENYFSTAHHHAAPASLEMLAAGLARADAQILNGKPQPARELLTRLLMECTTLDHTELYERSGRALADIGIEP